MAAAYAALIMEFGHQDDDTSGGKPEYLRECREKLKDIYDGIKKIFKQISTAEQEGQVPGSCRNLNLTEPMKSGYVCHGTSVTCHGAAPMFTARLAS